MTRNSTMSKDKNQLRPTQFHAKDKLTLLFYLLM